MNHAFDNARRHFFIAARNLRTAWRAHGVNRRLVTAATLLAIYCLLAAPGALVFHLIFGH